MGVWVATGVASNDIKTALRLGVSRRAAKASAAREIFLEVKGLALARLDDVFDAGGPIAVSIFPGPLHLANLLLSVAGDLVESGLCRVAAPEGVAESAWWKILRQAAYKRPYLWRNHREAIAEGYLTPGVSAAVSFPTDRSRRSIASSISRPNTCCQRWSASARWVSGRSLGSVTRSRSI